MSNVQVRVFNMGNSPINYSVTKGTTIGDFMNMNDIVPRGAYTLSVDNKTVTLETPINGGENIIISPNDLKGGM